MLSILIPSYNFDVRKLVHQLHQQGILLPVPFEIICMEDASLPKYVALNQTIKALSFVTHQVLSNNMGRSKIRNYLATKAQYDYLLFMDCDSMPVSEAYLSNYIAQIQPKQLLYGGRCYQEEAPTDSTLYFHWHYGTHREQSTPKARQKNSYQSFMTNNFLIPKEIFQSIRFDETLTQYGHEDTLFGLELQQKKIPIQHIDNPLEHIGLEPNYVFLKKSELAIQNLYTLHTKHSIHKEIKLLHFFLQTKRLYLHYPVLILYIFTRSFLKKNLFSLHPQLTLFDFYKLGYLIQWTKKQ
jgi:glycosyltransferase involved in cell wall biosynthesis